MSTIKNFTVTDSFKETFDRWWKEIASKEEGGASRRIRMLIREDLERSSVRANALKGLNEIMDLDPSSEQGQVARKVLEGLYRK